jgi:hypothetical protein
MKIQKTQTTSKAALGSLRPTTWQTSQSCWLVDSCKFLSYDNATSSYIKCSCKLKGHSRRLSDGTNSFSFASQRTKILQHIDPSMQNVNVFDDTKFEQDAFLKYVFPFMRRFCPELELRFEVVSMWWGVLDRSINAHMTSDSYYDRSCAWRNWKDIRSKV